MSHYNNEERLPHEENQTGRAEIEQTALTDFSLPTNINELQSIITILEKDLSKSRAEVFKLNEEWK